ncbi:MAG: MotA/TolQ/ExbB proton channel family protein [Gammaproteobacteria bacterium]|nr:MAG: MotA/TolQ/ExbB proton channel family protein [Gammaproteobacteria bacterium]
MRKFIITTFAVVCGSLATGSVMAQQSLDQLLQDVKKARSEMSAENKQREQRFQRERDNQRALLRDVQGQLSREEARSDSLTQQFNTNEQALSEMSENLRVQVGNFGEMFGVVRQVAGDTVGVVRSSLVSAQYPERGDVAKRLAEIKGLPSIDDLDALRILLFEEMVESGKVTRYPTTIVTADGNTEEADVVRVGVHNLVTGDRFLKYNAEDPVHSFVEELARQPQDRFRSMAADLFNASPGEVVGTAVDPSRGSLLGLLIQAPSLPERIDQGGVVGYVIIVLGIIGLLIAVWRLLYLSGVGSGIRRQLKSETASEKNPLGRILKVYDDNSDADTETLELKLDEAILREAPSLEKWQGGIKVLAAVAPLLGLLGTVTGMIATFQAITLFGTGDPKLMAGGISQALVTTVLGLCVAIPLVLLHSWVAGRSRALIEILEEQTAGIIARKAEADR